MARRTYAHTPDTCALETDGVGCIIEYEYDDADPRPMEQKRRVLRFMPKGGVGRPRQCSAHAGLTADEAASAIHVENPGRQAIIGELTRRFAAKLTQVVTDDDGNQRTVLLGGQEPVSYGGMSNGARAMIVNIGGRLTSGEKSQLRTALDNLLGSGRATVA